MEGETSEARELGEVLDELEARSCDRRDPEQSARRVSLSRKRTKELRTHLERHWKAFQVGNRLGGLDLFAPIPPCRWR
jgi:hypothetical protein